MRGEEFGKGSKKVGEAHPYRTTVVVNNEITGQGSTGGITDRRRRLQPNLVLTLVCTAQRNGRKAPKGTRGNVAMRYMKVDLPFRWSRT